MMILAWFYNVNVMDIKTYLSSIFVPNLTFVAVLLSGLNIVR